MNDPSGKAKSIFLEAIGRAPEDWPAFLDEICAGDPPLRARVERLLGAQAQLGSFHEAAPRAMLATIDEPLPERPGTIIGPYTLREQIGEGGMGLVYVAEQQQPVRRKVALKLIKPGMDSRQVIARFEAERQALAIMDHPNIAKILDAGTTDSSRHTPCAVAGFQGNVEADGTGYGTRCVPTTLGRPYFVMELVKGVPITEYCDANRLTTRARLELFGDVCAAVQHAHQKGIIHRDIKPSNVLVVSHDGTPVVKVIDFGVAKAIGQQLTDKTIYTHFTQFVGTPLYMSPEQAGQSGIDVDTRTDVYALGVLLYELLTGTTPFEKDRLRDATYDEMRRIIREEEPPKPSTRLSTLGQAGSTVSAQRQSEPKQLCKLLRGELDWIVMKALEKDRNRRYESVSALAADVQRYLQDEPVQACPPSAAYRLRKFIRRHKTRLVTIGLPTLVLLLVGAVGLWRQELKSAATAEALDDDLNEAARLLRDDQWAKAISALERAKGRLEESGSGPLEARAAELRREVGMVARLEEAQNKVRDFARETRDHAGADRAYQAAFADNGLDVIKLSKEEIARQIRVSIIRIHLVLALDYWAYVRDRLPKGDGEPLRAIARLADDDKWRQQLRDSNVIRDRMALEAMADQEGVLAQPPVNLLILCELLDKAKALGARLRLLRRAQERYPADFWMNLKLAQALFVGAGFETNSAAIAECVGFLRAALALHPRNPVAHHNLGTVLCLQQKLPEAEAALRKAIELNPDGTGGYVHLGEVLRKQKKQSEAMAAFRKASELEPDSGAGYDTLGLALINLEKFSQAEAAFRKAIELQPDYIAAYNNLGAVLWHQQKLPEAEAAFRKAIELQADYPDAYVNLGIVLRDLGKLPEAEAALRKAIELRPDHVNAYHKLGVALHDQHKLPEAEAAYRKAIKLDPDNAQVYYNLGVALHDQRNLPEAEAAYRKAIELKPNYAKAYDNLGAVMGEQENHIEAEAAFRKAIQLNPERAQAYDNLGIALRNQQKLPEAVAAHRKAIELKPDFAAAFNNLATALADQKMLPEAETAVRRAIELDPTFAEAHTNFAVALYKQEKYIMAAAAYLKAFDLHDLARSGSNLYNAACAAARAAGGQGKDVNKLDATERARLRGQALTWLRADLTANQKMLKQDPGKQGRGVSERMQHWQRSSSFDAVRGNQALAKLPEDERWEWRKLWQDVEELEKRAAESQKPAAPIR